MQAVLEVALVDIAPLECDLKRGSASLGPLLVATRCDMICPAQLGPLRAAGRGGEREDLPVNPPSPHHVTT